MNPILFNCKLIPGMLRPKLKTIVFKIQNMKEGTIYVLNTHILFLRRPQTSHITRV